MAKAEPAEKIGLKLLGHGRAALSKTGHVGLRGLKNHWPILLALSILFSLAVPFLLGGLRQFTLLKYLHWWAALVFVLMIFLSWLANANRLRLISQDVGKRLRITEGVTMTAAAEFAGVATPGSLGQAATYTYFFKQEGLRLGTAMGMMAVIVVTDLLFYISMMPCAAVALIFERHLKSNTTGLFAVVLGVAAGGTLILYVLIRHYRQVYFFLSRRLTRVHWLARRRYQLARMIVEFANAFRLIGRMSWGQRFGLYFSTVGYWLPRYGILLALIPLLGLTVPFAYLFLIQGVLNLGGQVFILPGGGGGVDAGYAVFLSPYLNREALALTLLLWRTFTFYWYLVIGGLFFLIKTGKAAHRLLLRKSV
jgi:uncharacterized protein (TIRG00374 family)